MATASLVDGKFWRSNAGTTDGQLLAKVTDLLEKGADVTAVGRNIKHTALHWAAMNQAGPEVVALLLEKGADVHAVGNDKSTALHLALENQGGPEVVALLLEKGADMNTVDSGNHTAFNLAVWNRAGPEVLELMLRKGASTEGIDLTGVEGDGEAQPLLAAAKVAAKVAAKATKTIADEAFWKAHAGNKGGQLLAKVADLLERGADVTTLTGKKLTPLHFAAIYKVGPEVVKLLLDNGADVHAENNEKRKALHLAAEHQAGPKVVGLLLERGADVHAVGRNGMTALHLSCANQADPDMVALLLQSGADVHALAVEGYHKFTALHYAAMNQADSKVVALLLEKGADVHAMDRDRRTALHYAAQHKAGAEVVALLLERAVDVHAVDDDKKMTALYYAAGNAAGLDSEVAGLLLAAGAINMNSNGDPILSPEQEAEARRAAPFICSSASPASASSASSSSSSSSTPSFAVNYMRFNENYLRLINHDDDTRVDAYIDALASAPDDEAVAAAAAVAATANGRERKVVKGHCAYHPHQCIARAGALIGWTDEGALCPACEAEKEALLRLSAPCKDREARLAEAKAVREHREALWRHRDTLDSAIAARDQSALEAAVAHAPAALEALPHSSSLRRELSARVSDVAAPLIMEVIFETARAPLDAAVASGDQAALEAAVAAAAPGTLPGPSPSPFAKEYRDLFNEAAFLAARAPLDAAISARDQAALEAAVANAPAKLPSSHDREFRALVKDDAMPLLDLVTLENEQKARPDELRIYVVSRQAIMDMHASKDEPRLKGFQDLRRSKQLEELHVTKQEVLSGALRERHKLLAISYPWQGFGDPDSTNERLDTVVAYLEKERPDIEHVWWDFMCVPQDTTSGEIEHPYPTTYHKNDFDELYFKTMINEGGVNLIYLGAYVLSIANALYIQRFWTQFEFYLGTRCVAGSAFGATDARLVVRCIQSLKDSTDEQSKALFAKWRNKTTAEAKAILAKRDVTVTNQSDKDNLLDKLPKLEMEYVEIFRALSEDAQQRVIEGHALEALEAGAGGGGDSGAEEATVVAMAASLRARLAAVEADNAALKQQLATSEAEKAALKQRAEAAEANLARALSSSSSSNGSSTSA